LAGSDLDGVSDRRVELGAASKAIFASVRGLPRVGWLLLVVGELVLLGVERVPAPVNAILELLVVALLEAYLVTVLLAPAVDPGAIARSLRRPYRDAVGLVILRTLASTALLVPILLVIYAAEPPHAAGTTPPLTANLIVVAVLLATAPFLARWSCSMPLIIQRGEGTSAAMRHSWAATRGFGVKLTCLFLVATAPNLISVVAPDAFKLPLLLVEGITGAVFGAAIAVVAFARLFPSLVTEYRLTDEGRLAFEADARILTDQGYVMTQSEDGPGTRTVTFGRPGAQRSSS
jgi:hypothetical protein